MDSNNMDTDNSNKAHYLEISIPKLRGYNLGMFSPGSGMSCWDYRKFLEENGLLFGLGPERVESVELTGRYLREDGVAHPSIDVLFRPKLVPDETRIRPWLNIAKIGKNLCITGGPIMLEDHDAMYFDGYCDSSMWQWGVDEPEYVRNVLQKLSSNPDFDSGKMTLERLVFDLCDGQGISSSAGYLPEIPFVVRYAMHPLYLLPLASDTAEHLLNDMIMENNGQRERPKEAHNIPIRKSTRPLRWWQRMEIIGWY